VQEAARFLGHCHQADPEMADLFEVLIGTGRRKGEALGLRWDDVHLAQGVLYVRCTLSAVDNNRLVITTPKTRSSRGGIAISPRVATALRRRAGSAARTRGYPSDPFAGLVFCRPDGRPLGPHLVLDRLSEEAGVPRVTVHDLRHLAVTLTISADVPLTVVSRTGLVGLDASAAQRLSALRHSARPGHPRRHLGCRRRGNTPTPSPASRPGISPNPMPTGSVAGRRDMAGRPNRTTPPISAPTPRPGPVPAQAGLPFAQEPDIQIRLGITEATFTVPGKIIVPQLITTDQDGTCLMRAQEFEAELRPFQFESAPGTLRWEAATLTLRGPKIVARRASKTWTSRRFHLPTRYREGVPAWVQALAEQIVPDQPPPRVARRAFSLPDPPKTGTP
ncbi:site-specific integrase, partial [Streptomyces hydrogenans]|uniref:site-specific integrase n=1 Tax=Streptomyces hydrogenans TaxID=1873719 RepID=UPI0036319F66